MKRFVIAPVLALLLLIPGAVLGQGQPLLNPDISFITDVRARAADATEDDLSFDLAGLEVAAQAYLNPFARGDIYLGIHEGELHVEEGFVTFTALPGGLGLRVGKFLVDAGRFNPQHFHVYPFIDYPLLVTEYLGPEGYGDVGVNPTYLFDLGAFPLTLSASVLNGDLGGHGHEDEEEHDHAAAFRMLQDEEEHDHAAAFRMLQEEEEHDHEGGRGIDDLAFNGRASAFFTLGDYTFLETGGSAGTALVDIGEELRTTWFGGDAKFKWRPNRRTSLTVAGEVQAHRRDMLHHDEVHETAQEAEEEHAETETLLGFFAYGDLQFRRHWNVGVLVDYVQPPEHPDEERLGFGGFVGYSVFEESTVIRLLVRHDDMPGEAENETSVQAQVVFGLGPHKPHQY